MDNPSTDGSQAITEYTVQLCSFRGDSEASISRHRDIDSMFNAIRSITTQYSTAGASAAVLVRRIDNDRESLLVGVSEAGWLLSIDDTVHAPKILVPLCTRKTFSELLRDAVKSKEFNCKCVVFQIPVWTEMPKEALFNPLVAESIIVRWVRGDEISDLAKIE